MGSKPKISPTEVFFLSFGGQSPFISLMAFGTVMISYVGIHSGFAMIVTTLVVMANASVVYSLSKRFNKGGGYYTYALHTLTNNLGITTGWMYILYSLSYGGTLMMGGVYVLNLLTGISPLYLTLIVSILASTIVIAGVKLSAKYAVAVGILEIIAILGLSIFFMYRSGFAFYNPIPTSLPMNLPEAILFGIGIPSGYSSIVSYPEEIENASKTVSRISLLVPVIGGGLASFFFYALAALGFTGNLVELLTSEFGLVGGILISAIALSDAVLGGIAYLLAGSRTLYNMSKNGHLISYLAREYKGQPKVAEVLISVLVILSLSFLSMNFSPLVALGLIGGVSGMSNLYIHMAAGVSLARMGRKKPLKHLHEIAFSVVSLAFSAWVLLISLVQLEKYVVYFFLGWIILGFLLAESLEMVKEEE
ncbi:amino acid/polyamine/organocation transporter, APC superfamily [Metallosphaera sedula]|uniref:Amino acid/polyamine/organocation transporter, APC superfamily n=4 Tax=Metallosphaera TaxID=41980 RepID=A4YGQ2_METS5|nr:MULTISPECIES: APC family permease [Metallosphaera]ABP95604.1 amino acid/polyamine/organocation transporter, APC superfamily [Metallosphaera sedula DSM 5348]AIM27588.1 amino acid/polyamine/organocation transporter, APC superfamily [Metallosphaera sedula]AKV74449.1 amino acid permease [Metallosphaera sedula]AKV76688.1 amino acid permease [Metallosphaera sedula]AKV78939.1 amino acid permease [Metallosphaera sedula]